MSKFKSEKVMPRYFAIAVVLTLIGFAIVGKPLLRHRSSVDAHWFCHCG